MGTVAQPEFIFGGVQESPQEGAKLGADIAQSRIRTKNLSHISRGVTTPNSPPPVVPLHGIM